YEPVWAIGTGETPTPDDANQVAAVIRSTLAGLFGEEAAAQVRIQYGGSVNADNIASFAAQPHIDGALVGGASLAPDSFARIVRKTGAILAWASSKPSWRGKFSTRAATPPWRWTCTFWTVPWAGPRCLRARRRARSRRWSCGTATKAATW